MSYSWGFIKTDKQVRVTGAFIVGMFLCFVIGIPLSRILEYYEFEVPIWLWAVFAIMVFSSFTFFTYKMINKKKSKK